MVDLADDAAVIEVHGVGQLLEGGDVIVPRDPQIMDGRDAVDIIYTGVFVDDHAEAAFRALLIISDLARGGQTVFIRHVGSHRHHDAAVFDGHGADPARCEQFLIHIYFLLNSSL